MIDLFLTVDKSMLRDVRAVFSLSMDLTHKIVSNIKTEQREAKKQTV